MTEYEKGRLIGEGKTKKIFEVVGNPNLAIIQYKNTITKFDDPDLTREFEKKAEYSNTTTCRVFELLKRLNFLVAFEKQISPIEFLAPVCKMLPFEVVTRRYAFGSYLQRNPAFKKPEGEQPHRFDDIVVEFFLKTTKGKLVNSEGRIIVEGLDPKKGEEDPLIINPYDKVWTLYHPKKTAEDKDVELRRGILASEVINLDYPSRIIGAMADYAKGVFLALERAWDRLDCRLVDMKIEFGISPTGELLIADVIDPDSWRLWKLIGENWEDFSKQSFRDGEALSEVERKYGIVANLSEKFKNFIVS
jgi:phosphoribosylaminoimidazole-succinocarboxamide synthase